MKYPQHLDMVRMLHIKYQIGIPADAPRAQVRRAQLLSLEKGARARPSRYLAERATCSFEEAPGYSGSGFVFVIIAG
jgi:hypothetical protein